MEQQSYRSKSCLHHLVDRSLNVCSIYDLDVDRPFTQIPGPSCHCSFWLVPTVCYPTNVLRNSSADVDLVLVFTLVLLRSASIGELYDRLKVLFY